MSVGRNNLLAMKTGVRNSGKRLLAVFLFAAVLFSGKNIFAASLIASFVFTTDPQTVSQGKLSDVLQIQARDATGSEIKTLETIDLEFSSTSSTGEFLNATANPVSTVMSKGTANRSFYYRDFTSGSHTLKIKAQGRDSGTSWTVSQMITISTPQTSSGGTQTVSSAQAVGAVPASPSPQSPPLSSNAQIQVNAGADQTVTVGSLVEFEGTAVGLKKEPLETARFWWNFGDGETQEGRSTTHIFRVPGTYIIGLHVSSGEYSSSDYVTARVLVNQMSIKKVIPGEEGYIQLANPLNVESDIGGWAIEDGAQKKFFIPAKTKIAAGGELSFANTVTGLLRDGASYSLIIQYPNGTTALTYAFAGPDDSAGKAPTSSPSVKIPPASAPVLQVAGSLSRSKGGAVARMEAPRAPKPASPIITEDGTVQVGGSDAENRVLQNTAETKKKSAAAVAGFSLSSRVLFTSVIGLSALGALGFFVLKRFLI